MKVGTCFKCDEKIGTKNKDSNKDSDDLSILDYKDVEGIRTIVELNR